MGQALVEALVNDPPTGNQRKIDYRHVFYRYATVAVGSVMAQESIDVVDADCRELATLTAIPEEELFQIAALHLDGRRGKAAFILHPYLEIHQQLLKRDRLFRFTPVAKKAQPRPRDLDESNPGPAEIQLLAAIKFTIFPAIGRCCLNLLDGYARVRANRQLLRNPEQFSCGQQ